MPATTATAATDEADGPTIVERVTYRQLSNGTLEATVAFDLPETVTAFEFRFAQDYHDVVGVEGFERTDGGSLSWSGDGARTYAWDGETSSPRVVLRHDPTVGEPASYAGGSEDWAVVLRPPTTARWRYAGDDPDYAYEAAVDGAGVAGDRFLALGAHDVHERSVATSGERVRLVVPEAADLEASPERVLDSLAAASERLRVGERSDVVTVIAAPTSVTWEHRGLSLGPDARVAADQRVTRAPNLWIHEYVHTRQDRDATTRETSWLVEASAEYYAAAIPLARGDVSYAEYSRALDDGATIPRRGSVLAEPRTWRAQAQYHKGSLVIAALDRELRAASGGEATFQDVVREWNGADRFDGDDFAARLDALGGEPTRTFGVRHARTNATPSLVNRSRHEAAFGRDLPESGRVADSDDDVGLAGARGSAGGAGAADGSGARSGGPIDGSDGDGADGLLGAIRRTFGETVSRLGGVATS